MKDAIVGSHIHTVNERVSMPGHVLATKFYVQMIR